MSVVIAIDAGTTGVRSFARARRRHRGGLRLPRVHPALPPARLGRARRRPRSGPRCRRRSPSSSARLDEPIAAIGITDQRETVVAWDRRTGQPLHRAIVWQDRRTAARCDELRERGLRADSCGPPPASCSTRTSPPPRRSGCSPRAAWRSRPTSPSAPSTPGCCGTSPAAPNGGVLATEPSNASRTMLFDIRTLAWSDELLDRFGVPASALPEVRPSSGRFGVTARGTGRARGHPGVGHRRRPAGRPVRPGLPRAGHDQEHLRHRQLRAHARGRHAARSRSTGCSPRSAGRWPTAPRAYALEGAIFVTGAAVQWLRDGLGIIESAERDRGARRDRARHRGLLPRAGLHRPRQPVVGSLRPGHDRRHHPGHRPRPPRPRRARVDQPPDARRGRAP